jgi:hypothetical protein
VTEPATVARALWLRAALLSAIVVALVAACGGNSTPSPSTTAPSASVAAVDRHLSGNVDANRLFQILSGAGLPVNQESVTAGPNGEPTTILFLKDGFQALTIEQYSGPKAVSDAGFTPGSKLVKGDSPYTFWAVNLVIRLGPRIPNALPAGPTLDLQNEAARVVNAIDPYIGPLQQRSIAPVALPSTPEPVKPSPSPSTKSPAPSPSKK